MDYSTIGGIAGMVSLVVTIGVQIVNLVNHKRCRSRCCHLAGIISMDIENTTPQTGTPPQEKAFLAIQVDGTSN